MQGTKKFVNMRQRSYKPEDELNRSIDIKDNLSRIVRGRKWLISVRINLTNAWSTRTSGTRNSDSRPVSQSTTTRITRSVKRPLTSTWWHTRSARMISIARRARLSSTDRKVRTVTLPANWNAPLSSTNRASPLPTQPSKRWRSWRQLSPP